MFVWRKQADPDWLGAHEERLRERAGTQLAIVQKPNRKTALVEVAGRSRRDLEGFRAEFGGAITKLPPDWLRRAQDQETKSIQIGKRLIVARSRKAIVGRALRLPKSLIIPPGAAFGTGEHATTAMSLRLLEEIARELPSHWTMLDLGTGTGILALAARQLGAKKVVAIDCDPLAIATAKENAHLNRIDRIKFRLGDAREFSSPAKFDVVSANLYSELLIEILPRLMQTRWLVLSGILRDQEAHVLRALRRNKIEVVQLRRRGKWLAVHACGSSGTLRRKRI